MNDEIKDKNNGFLMSTVRLFLQGRLSIIFIVFALSAGLISLLHTPREEEPQIVVPMVDVFVSFPGHSAQEVEELVTTPLERILWQINGVEHVYSRSDRDHCMVTVRFYVGEDRERSMVKIRDKIDANLDIVPPGVTGWIIKPVEIDDVPIVSLTLFSKSNKTTPDQLRRIAEELKSRLDSQKNISLSNIIGGYKRSIRVEPDPDKLTARNLTFDDIIYALKNEKSTAITGSVVNNNKHLSLIVFPQVSTAEDLANIAIKNTFGSIIRIRDVAVITDSSVEQNDYVRIGFGPASSIFKNSLLSSSVPAVTVAFSKKKGTNAVKVAENIISNAKELSKTIFPDDVEMIVSRNYGKLADEKVNDLVSGLFFAVVTVVGLLAITMGWREGIIVGIAVPVSFSLSLLVNFLAGYTINRVTLFALILSLGLVVDDPITNVDNIQRHLRMKVLPPLDATIFAIKEVLSPVIFSTIAIIICFTPMFFITGMMGPYMRPMAINVPLTVSFSTVCALSFVPWLALKLLGNSTQSGLNSNEEAVNPLVEMVYSKLASPFLKRKNALFLCLVTITLAIISAILLVTTVPLKMLPFDNKDELQIVIDMPRGTTLEQTAVAVADFEEFLKTVNEVDNFQSYIGTSSPVDFNGLVRRYNLRNEPHMADIRVNFVHKKSRKAQSHAIALRLRRTIEEIAKKHNADVKIVEVPPGPPVLSTVVVELRGQPSHSYQDMIIAAQKVKDSLKAVGGQNISELDDSSETPNERLEFVVDKDKAALHGLRISQIHQALYTAISGTDAIVLNAETERNPLIATVRLSYQDRNQIQQLKKIRLRSNSGKLVELGELGYFRLSNQEQPIYRKNLERVVFVTAETPGKAPGEIIIKTIVSLLKKPIEDFKLNWAGEGEWEITLRVFRDLGIAFAVALLGIYLMLIIQTESFSMPLVIMSAIPMTIIGIAPGFFLLNLVSGKNVNGYADPVFFTATAMIGMIALGGIVIRNSMVLIEFIEASIAKGNKLEDAILQSGTVRFRPIMLTAVTTLLGSWPITLDPVFSGLAWALIFGLLASTFFTLLIIPSIYVLLHSGKSQK